MFKVKWRSHTDTETYWSVLKYIEVYWGILRYTFVCLSILKHAGVYWSVLKYTGERRKSPRREARKRGAHNEFSPQRAVDPVHSDAGLADIFPSMIQAFG